VAHFIGIAFLFFGLARAAVVFFAVACCTGRIEDESVSSLGLKSAYCLEFLKQVLDLPGVNSRAYLSSGCK